MAEKKTSLRVLYTINSSPQYILARSLLPVNITIIPFDETNNGAKADASQPSGIYASVLLKTCLTTICRSSPELTQDPTRDFSLYVLDPLESNSAPAPVNISDASAPMNPAEQPRGVAVGLGLMSWALSSDDGDKIPVTGTLVKQGTGQEALEVIFALRETLAMKQRSWNAPSTSSQESSSSYSTLHTESKPLQWYSSSQGSSFVHQSSSTSVLTRSASTSDITRGTLASIQMRSKAKVKPSKPARQSNTPVTESDKFMNADIYIGPLKKKGRPKATGVDNRSSSKPQGNASASGSGSLQSEVIVIDGSDTESNLPTPTDTKNRFSSTVPLVDRPSDPGVQVKIEPKEPTLLDLLTLFSATSSPAEPNAPNAALLAALNAIDSSKSQGSEPVDNTPNPALVSALQQLLAVCAKPSPAPVATPLPPPPSTSIPIATNPEPVRRHHQTSSSSQSEGIVILDKENVNPVAFKKRSAKGSHDKLSDSVGSSSSFHLERPVQSLGLSTRSNELKASASLPGTDKVVRKRTLSDFMDEKESGKSKEKGKERERVERRDSLRHSSNSRQAKAPAPDPTRHYPQVLSASLPRQDQPTNYYRMPLEPWTSPVRSRPETDENYNAGSSGSVSPPKQASPRYQKVSASSPVRAPKESRRKYVVPEWARTNTATQPRLSEETQRAMEEAEQRKKEERNATRRKLANSQAKLKNKDSTTTLKAVSLVNIGVEQSLRPAFVVPKKPDLSRGPIAASSDGPMIAFPLLSSSSRSSSPPPNPPSSIPKTPKTPSRNRIRSTPQDDSLFTPIMRSGSLFGSAYSQHSTVPGPPSILTSPLGNRKKAKISPSRSVFTGKSYSAMAAWSNSGSPKASSDSTASEDPFEETKQSKNKDLDDVLDDLDGPPSSQPIVSSDIDINGAYSQTSGETNEDIEDDVELHTVKQHWAGLPPSSPPPPSSPMLLPEDPRTDDEEMDDIPIATSDSETDTDMNAFDLDITSPNTIAESPADSTEGHLMTLSEEDLSAFFSIDNNPSSTFHQLSSSTSLDLFEQFTNVNAQSDDLPPMDDDLQNVFQNDIESIDFTEFWETFKPLLSENVQPLEQNGEQQNSSAGPDFFGADDSQLLSSFGDVDHAKLADDMQTLLSGCLM